MRSHLALVRSHLPAVQVAGGSISEAREEAARLVAAEEGVHMLQGHDDALILAGQVSREYRPYPYPYPYPYP